jgi:regulator of sigma D
MTFSADGTCHRSINYNSHHVHLKAESYKLQDGTEKKRVTRFFGIHSALDASSEEAMKDWDKCFDSIVDIFNCSPFGKQTGDFLRTVEILLKICGMNSDHCKKEKKDAHLMEQKKAQATYQTLGEKEILESSNEDLMPYFLEANKEMIESVGGKNKWDSLPEHQQKEHLAKMMEQLVIKLGKEAYEMLSDQEKEILKLFIWAGCGCHKDLNTVRGGYAAVM